MITLVLVLRHPAENRSINDKFSGIKSFYHNKCFVDILSQVAIDGRQVDFSTSSGLSDPVFGANINGSEVLLQVRMSLLLHTIADYLVLPSYCTVASCNFSSRPSLPVHIQEVLCSRYLEKQLKDDQQRSSVNIRGRHCTVAL